MMRRLALAAAVLAGAPAIALADDVATQRWPEVPADPAPSLEDQIVDHLSAYGDRVGDGLDRLSDHMLTLHVDGRHNRAHLGIGGGGDGHLLTFRLDSDWLFAHGEAQVDATLELGLGEHHLELKLPAMDIVPDSWHGQDVVVVDVNLLQRRF